MIKSASSDNSVAQVIAVTSGKGGVGKTSLTINLGFALSQLGHRVCLLDADSNLANINIMLRMMPEYTMEHVLKGEKGIRDILLHKSGISLVPGASGLTEIVDLSADMQQRMLLSLAELERSYDHMLVDTSAGISEHVLSFIEAAHQCLLVLSPEPTSLTDAFSLLRVLKKRGYSRPVSVVVNYAQTELNARKVFNRFSAAVTKYIGCSVGYLGFVLRDDYMSSAISLQKPILLQKPQSQASRSLIRLAGHLDRLTRNDHQDEPVSERLARHLQTEPDMSDLAVPKVEVEAADDEIEGYEDDDVDTQYTRKQVLRDHSTALRSIIEDPEIPRLELRTALNELLEAYVGRFNDYPFDATRIIDHALEMEKVPSNKLGQLMMTLQLFYQDQISQLDRETSAQQLRQLINGYVDAHRAYPFDVIYTLYKYLDLQSVPEQQLRQLLTNLHLIYEDKYRVGSNLDESEQSQYCPEHEQAVYEKVVAMLQDKHLHNLALKMKNDGAVNDHRNGEEESPAESQGTEKKKPVNPLLDSIRFASLTD